MDRSKSRTDLLAAGKKRLQQFRQKKDSKGGSSHGKSSKKSAKSQQNESDADTASVTPMSTASSKVTDGNVEIDSDSNLAVTESLESQSLANSLPPTQNDPSVDLSSVAITYDAGIETKLALLVENDSESSVQDRGDSAQDVHVDVEKDVPLRISESLGSDGGVTSDHTATPVNILPPSTSTVGESVTVERESDQREESLLLSKDQPSTSLMQTREDQEAESLDRKNSCQSIDAEIDVQKKLPLVQVCEGDQSVSGITLDESGIQEASHEVEQIGKAGKIVNSLEGIVSNKFSASDKGLQDDIATAGPFMRTLERETLPGSSYEEMLLQSSQEQIRKGVLSGQDMGLQEGLNQQNASVGSVVAGPILESSIEAHEVNLARPLVGSPLYGVGSVNLLQLAEIIRGLDEEEYHFLLKSRGAVSDLNPLASSSILPDHDFSEACQRPKEELFHSDIMKKVLNLQLAEQQELLLESDNHRYLLIGELSQLQASNNETDQKNQHLTEELANCRVELYDVSSKCVELQNQFNSAKAEVEALSARLIELQISFEMSQQDSSDLSMELAECRGLISGLQVENKDMNETLDLVIAEKNKLVEEKDFHLCESKKLATELADFKSSMEGVVAENTDLSERISLVTEERNKMKAEIEHLSHEIDSLSLDLVENKDLVAKLDAENSKLIDSFALSADKVKNLEVDNQHVALENKKFSSQIVSLEERISIEKGERIRFEGGLREAMMRLEQLAQENILLNNTLDVHKAKSEEIGKKQSHLLSQYGDLGNQAREQSECLEIAITGDSLRMDQEPIEESAPGGPPVNIFEQEIFDDSAGFVSLNSCLDEVEKVLIKLEKAIDVLHCESASPGWSGEQVSSPGVSNLMHAFESKTLQDEHVVEGRDSSEVRSATDSFIMLTKEQIENLRKLLTKWRVDVQNAGALFRWEQDGSRKVGDAKYSYLKDQFEELKEQCSNLEASNVELTVQCEAAKQLLGDIQEKKFHLEELCEALKQEDIYLKAKSSELYEKLGRCQTKICELLAEIYDLKHSSTEMASVIGSQLKNLQEEVTERALLLEQGWNTTITEIVESVRKLDESVGLTLSSTISSDTHVGLDISHRVAVSVTAATEVIFELQTKLEATYSEHEEICTSYEEVNKKCDDLVGKNELAVGVLCKIYSHLRKLVHSHCEPLDEVNVDVQSAELPDLLNYNSYETILKLLGDILNEKLEIEAVTKGMKSELLQREKTELAELEEKMHYLNSLRLENENEIHILKVSLHQAEEALAATHSAFHEKTIELEHSEQRVSSIREKLSIAVAKGKGLVVQRDGLKQSLAETSSELERCFQELQLKDTRLHEVENMLKTYAEAGEHVEALESELSYVRNSAKALRESFLLNDSVLQRIEEVLEDLDLPEQFHSRDIIEKIEWLARSVAGNSLPMNDWEQKDSSRVGSCSDAGLVVMDSWKDDSQIQPDSRDDFRKKFEELQSKYYGLAEQNEMLEQSLLERNSLVQRWEELLDRIDMPSHLQSIETEERIEWVGRALAEANHHVVSLQMKIDKYDSYCGLLNADLEESQRKVATLHADLRAATSERQVLSEKMEIMIYEYKQLSAQTRQAELENDKLHNEITSLKEKLEQKAAIEEQISTMDDKIKKLLNFVGDVLAESEKEILVSSGASIDSLEDLLRKLIENHPSLSSMKPTYGDGLDGHHSQKDDATLHEASIDMHDKEIPNIDSYKKDLDEALSELVHVKQERDRALAKQISLSGEVESLSKRTEELLELLDQEEQKSASLAGEVKATSRQTNELQGLLNQKEQKLASLSGEFESLTKRTEELQELLNQEEHKSASLSSEVKALCKRTDKLHELLNQEEQKSASLLGEVKALSKITEELHELLKQEEQKSASLSGAVEALSKRTEELQELLNQEEQESASLNREVEALGKGKEELQELLNQEEQKSASSSLEVEALSKRKEELQELLNQKEQKSSSLSGEVKALRKRTEELQELLDLEEQKPTSFSGEVEALSKRTEQLQELLNQEEQKTASLSSKVEALSKRSEELQELLKQEEQKSASVREKLNIAVRKGKSLVQQRDSLKQTNEEMGIEMEHLKSEINNRDHTLAEHAHKLRQLSTYPDRLEALESESLLLKNHLAETENHLLEREHSLKMILNKLDETEVVGEGHISDPVKKLEWVGKLCSDLHCTVVSLEQESKKSKRASELLLAELNEVQERNDVFQEELAKVAAELVDLRKERESAEAAKLEALSQLEKLSALHFEGKKSQFSEIMGLKSRMNQLHKDFDEIQKLLANAFSGDLESFWNLQASLESCIKGNNVANVLDSCITRENDDILLRSADNKRSLVSSDFWSDFDTIDHYDDGTIEICHVLGHQLQEFLLEINSIKANIRIHSNLAQDRGKTLCKLMASVLREMYSQRESCETMKKEISAQDGELVALREKIAYLYEACINSVILMGNGKAALGGKNIASSDLEVKLKASSFDDGTSEECIKTVADRLLLAAKEFASIKTEFLDANQKEMKATITNLQRELQEKDVQRDGICSELVKQIKDAEAAANSCSQDLQSLRIQEHNLKKQVEEIEAERLKLKQRVNEMQDQQQTAAELEENIRSQTDLLAAKDQEIEELMHALDEEELQMEESTKKILELEKAVQHRNQEIENLESSRAKVMKKLSITVSKFDELHHLSATLLSEVEKLQSQLQERDTEISFLRQEVTRCTNDVLALQMSNKRSSDEFFELLMWVDMMVSGDGMHDMLPDVKSNSQVDEYKEIFHKKLMSVLSELENLREVAESKDAMLQVERSKVEELSHKAEILEMSLHEKESRLNLLEGVEETGREASTSSEILEVEPMINKWTAAETFVTPQFRSLRKVNKDHVAIAVDVEPGSSSRIEDEEDDKVHGFKSLTSSKIVPKFTRPLTDLIDGLWVSCDRTLMRQPVLRLGIIIYWAIMHALLAFFVV